MPQLPPCPSASASSWYSSAGRESPVTTDLPASRLAVIINRRSAHGNLLNRLGGMSLRAQSWTSAFPGLWEPPSLLAFLPQNVLFRQRALTCRYRDSQQYTPSTKLHDGCCISSLTKVFGGANLLLRHITSGTIARTSGYLAPKPLLQSLAP